jgi:GNAT superfamily N-acetyltransferase
MIDLRVVEARLREAAGDRYHGKSVAVKIARNSLGIHVTIWPTRGRLFFNQWVNVRPDGVVEFPAPDDGFTPINAKPLYVTTTFTDSAAFDEALALLDGAVDRVQQMIDQSRVSLLGDYRVEQVDADLLAAACLRWQGGRDGGSTLLRAGARVAAERQALFQRRLYQGKGIGSRFPNGRPHGNVRAAQGGERLPVSDRGPVV